MATAGRAGAMPHRLGCDDRRLEIAAPSLVASYRLARSRADGIISVDALRNHRARALAVVAAAAVLCGCASDPWARYQASVYTTIHEPGPATWNAHLDLLQQIVARAEDRGTKPPPGVCAECGLYLVRLGRAPEADAYLEREQRYYPESVVFVTVMRRYAAGVEKLLDDAKEATEPGAAGAGKDGEGEDGRSAGGDAKDAS